MTPFSGRGRLVRPERKQVLHVVGRDGLHTLFYFPEGEEMNADAARAYYDAHDFSSILHSVANPDDYFRALRDEGHDPTFVLRTSRTAGTLVYAARKWAGLSVYGMAPGRENLNRPDGLLSWVFAVLAAIYCYMVGGTKRDDPVFLPVVRDDTCIVRPREHGTHVNLALALVDKGVDAAAARSRNPSAERSAELANCAAAWRSDAPLARGGDQGSFLGHGRRVRPKRQQVLQVSLERDGLTMHFHFPEGEETNADAARAYYEAHDFSSILHPVADLNEYIRTLTPVELNTAFFLRRTGPTGTLVFAARKWAGLSVYGIAPGKPNLLRSNGFLSWMVASLVSFYCEVMGGGRRDDPVYIGRRDDPVYIPDSVHSIPVSSRPRGQGAMDEAHLGGQESLPVAAVDSSAHDTCVMVPSGSVCPRDGQTVTLTPPFDHTGVVAATAWSKAGSPERGCELDMCAPRDAPLQLPSDTCTRHVDTGEASQTRGLEPDGVLADTLGVRGRTVTFGRRCNHRVHTFVYSDPISGDSFIPPRVRARAALKPSSFHPPRAVHDLLNLYVRELPENFLTSDWTMVSRCANACAAPFQVGKKESLSSLASSNPFSTLTSEDVMDDASLFTYDWVDQVLQEASAPVAESALPLENVAASVNVVDRALEDVSVSVAEAGLPSDADDITASVGLLPSLDPLAPDFAPSTLDTELPPREVCGSATCADVAMVSGHLSVNDDGDEVADVKDLDCPVVQDPVAMSSTCPVDQAVVAAPVSVSANHTVDAAPVLRSEEPLPAGPRTEGPRSIRKASPGQLVWLKNMEDC